MHNAVRLMCIAAWLTAAPVTSAVVVSKQLSNVTFDDGGAASGYMVLNTDLNLVTDFDIVTTAGSRIASQFEYRIGTARIAGQVNEVGDSFLQLVSLPGAAPDGNRDLYFAFATPLVEGQPTAILYQGGVGQVSYEHQSLGEHLQKTRLVTGPQVVSSPAVPEPSEMACLVVGICCIYGVVTRTRRKRQ